MIALMDIPFSIDADAEMSGCRIEPGSDDARDFLALVDLAAHSGRPKAVCDVAFIEARRGDTVTVGGVTFESRALAHNLRSVERVFAFVSTCGREMDDIFPAKGDILQEYWWDAIKLCLLGAAESHVLDHLRCSWRLEKTATMRPGSGDVNIWPLEQQRELFALLGDVEGAIGVTLTESHLMVPNKTTSGLLYPTETSFRSCEICHREACPSRHAAFNASLWDEIHGPQSEH